MWTVLDLRGCVETIGGISPFIRRKLDVDIRNSDVFSRFVRYSYLSKRSTLRNMGSMQTLLILKQTLIGRIQALLMLFYLPSMAKQIELATVWPKHSDGCRCDR